MVQSSRLSESTLLIDYSTMSMNSVSSSSNAFATVDDDDNNNNNSKCQQQQRNQQQANQKQQANQNPTTKHKRLLQMLQGGWKKEQSTNVTVEEDFNLLLQQQEFTGDEDKDDDDDDDDDEEEEEDRQQQQEQEGNVSLLLIPADPLSDIINLAILKDCKDDICSSATDADTGTDTASFISTINDTNTNTNTNTNTSSSSSSSSNTNTNANTIICTSSTSSSNNNTKTTRKKQQQQQEQKHVRFGSLTIHEHPLIMGGAGLPLSGPSISLSWKQDTCIELPSVILYEESRPCLPRKGIEMLYSKNQRIDLLLGSGYTFREIKQCDKECDIIRKQRIQTVKKVQQRSSITRIGNKIREKIFKSKKPIMQRSVTNSSNERRKRANTI
jgi:hypothetical protein